MATWGIQVPAATGEETSSAARQEMNSRPRYPQSPFSPTGAPNLPTPPTMWTSEGPEVRVKDEMETDKEGKPETFSLSSNP